MQLRQRRLFAGRAVATLNVIFVIAAVGGCGGSATAGKQAAPAKLDAPGKLEPVKPAPEIALHDYTGRPVRLSQYRGKAVFLTFIYDHCPDTCPLIVSKLHAALELLGPKANQARVVAVSVDPLGDTPKTVKAFVQARGMTGRMDYLVGSLKQLAPVWKRYDISAEASPESRENPQSRAVSHTALIYGITASGKWLALYDAANGPREFAHDVPILASS